MKLTSFNEAYLSAFKYLIEAGFNSIPRSMPVKELLSHKFGYQYNRLANSEKVSQTVKQENLLPFMFLSGRALPLPFNLYEAIWILAGRNDVASLDVFNKRMKMFSDDGKKFNAPYGDRLLNDKYGDQIRQVINLITEDNDTRQAVMCIWDKCDLFKKSKDIPCNDLIMVKKRGKMLNFSISNVAIFVTMN